jgi:hypothetical protein
VNLYVDLGEPARTFPDLRFCRDLVDSPSIGDCSGAVQSCAAS